MIFEGLSGRMGEPEDTDAFVRFQADDITVYISRQLLEEKIEPGTTQITFYIDGYGRHKLILPNSDVQRTS